MSLKSCSFLSILTGVVGLGAAASPAFATPDFIVGNGAPIPGYSAGYITTTRANPSSNPIPLPLVGTALLGLDTYYELTLSITDETGKAPQPSYYAATIGGIAVPLSQVNTVGTFPDTFTGSLIFNDGPNPPSLNLLITNEYQALNKTETDVPTDAFVITVSESAAPEPASLAMLGMGLGLLGLARRRRARG